MAEEKKPKPKNPTSHKMFEIKGETVERKNRNCPKCGKGFFLAKHKDRLTCGKCKYSEITSSKKSEEKK